MKRFSTTIYIALGIATLCFLVSPLPHVLFEFMLLGKIPGMNEPIPYWVMITGYCLLSSIALTYFVMEYYSALHRHRKASLKSVMPKRRYRRVSKSA